MKSVFLALALSFVARSAFALVEMKLKCSADSPGSLVKSIQLDREYDETTKKVSWFVSYQDAWNQSGRVLTRSQSTPVSVKYPLPVGSGEYKIDLVVGYGSEPSAAILMYGLDADGKADATVDFLKNCEHRALSPLPR